MRKAHLDRITHEKLTSQQAAIGVKSQPIMPIESYACARNSDIADFVIDPFTNSSDTTPWQQATSILNKPVTAIN